MKLISWNVNGIRSVKSKNKQGAKLKDKTEPSVIYDLIETQKPDILCLQEIKCGDDHTHEFDVFNDRYPHIFTRCSKARKGYSGVAVLCKAKPSKVHVEFERFAKEDDTSRHDFTKEGRLITLEFENYFVVCCYTPNSKPKLERLNQRTTDWEPLFKAYVASLQKEKLVIVCGDLNVAHTELDIHTTKGHTRSAGFTNEERECFSKLLDDNDLVDTFRLLHPDERKYSYFSNFGKSRENNKGWRIDYALISNSMKTKIKSADILTNVRGSDHVPIMLELK